MIKTKYENEENKIYETKISSNKLYFMHEFLHRMYASFRNNNKISLDQFRYSIANLYNFYIDIEIRK